MEKIMKIGVISDSHGEIDNLKKVARWLIKKQNVDTIIHLGDNFDDTTLLANLGVNIIKVPGVFSKYYQNIFLTQTFINWKCKLLLI